MEVFATVICGMKGPQNHPKSPTLLEQVWDVMRILLFPSQQKPTPHFKMDASKKRKKAEGYVGRWHKRFHCHRRIGRRFCQLKLECGTEQIHPEIPFL